jgi:hypothetical protein
MSILAHRFIFINRRGHYLSKTATAAAILGAALAIFAGTADLHRGSGHDDHALSSSAQSSDKYRQLLTETELMVAATDQPYLILDFPQHVVYLKLRGAVIADWPYTVENDNSAALRNFADAFTDERTTAARSMSYMHLFKAHRVFSDSILAIVAEALTVSPDLLQRYEPAHLSLAFGDGLYIHVKSDTPGSDESFLGNAVESFRESIAGLPGGASLTINLDAQSALSLCGACRSGVAMFVSY